MDSMDRWIDGLTAIQEATEAWESEKRQRLSEGGEYRHVGDEEFDQLTQFEAHVPVPTLEDMDKILLEKKKQALLDKYVTPVL